MKKIGFILLTLILSVNIAVAQNGSKAAKAQFSKTVHDFGKIETENASGKASCVFTFKNTGDAPLIIQRVQTTCGCTTPDYTKKPILPGEEGKIDITYTGTPGVFTKQVKVFSNVPDEVYVLSIKGEVVRKR